MAAKKSTTKKSAAKSVKKTTKKAPAKKAAAKTTKKAPAKKAPAKKAAAKTTKKAAAKKAPSAETAAPARKSSGYRSANTKITPPSERVIPKSAKFLFDKKWLADQKASLERERENYTNSAERLAAEAAALMADREPGDVQFDEESGEGDTIAVERDRDLALSAAALQSVAEIDAALERLEKNTYGLCVAGDDVIPKERLEAIPEASVCVQHKTSMF